MRWIFVEAGLKGYFESFAGLPTILAECPTRGNDAVRRPCAATSSHDGQMRFRISIAISLIMMCLSLTETLLIATFMHSPRPTSV